ncbi:benzoate 4-monooxygenase cytochrome P450 [Fusarium albosuccineum]|uniref:Benzoate 4-monooxygenase cytochrome P450 n=1 Tax=Fusarium albosuccineum TaxID=1237068 RepID=A0A8H4LGF3_9HYPO|nr:benzoate 4-monooxygenase cytochrome P450 [Fusarium albosuccineum]
MAVLSSLRPSFCSIPWLVAEWWRTAVVGGGALYVVTKILYRRFWHPLANVPGPFLPAVTRLYAWYYNVPGEGKFYKEIERLHSVYGPIVRITPDEVHLSNPKNYDIIYGLKSDFYKDPRFYGALGIDSATFSTFSNELHRRRRALMNPFFSKRKVLELESLDVIHDKVEKLCRIVSADRAAKRPTNLHAAFRAISVDVITDYAFDESWNQLDADDLGQWFSDMIRSSADMFWTFQAFPSLRDPIQGLPESIAKKMSPSVGDFLAVQGRTRKQAEDVQARVDQGIQPKRTTIWHQLLDPNASEGNALPDTSDLVDEAFAICTAAADTTGNAMTMAAFHVVTNPDIYDTLTRELRDAFPDRNERLTFSDLEKLPYLTGVIKEGQRLSYGVISRLPRVVPEGGVEMEGYYLPEGTVASMSSWMMHHDPDAFPNPEKFDPTRWTDPSAFHERDKCLVPFSRGRRMCIGQNLAWCELYVTLGTLFRRFEDLRAFEVDAEDMVYVDYFSAFNPPEKRRFKITSGSLDESFMHV